MLEVEREVEICKKNYGTKRDLNRKLQKQVFMQVGS